MVYFYPRDDNARALGAARDGRSAHEQSPADEPVAHEDIERRSIGDGRQVARERGEGDETAVGADDAIEARAPRAASCLAPADELGRAEHGVAQKNVADGIGITGSEPGGRSVEHDETTGVAGGSAAGVAVGEGGPGLGVDAHEHCIREGGRSLVYRRHLVLG